jgi:hypothetical protein
VGLRQDLDGAVTVCPIEQVLLLRDGAGMPGEAVPLIAVAEVKCAEAQAFASATLAHEQAEAQRERLRATLPQREQFVRQGYRYQEAELAEARRRVSPAARAGDPHARGELTRILERQMSLAARRDEAIAVLRREPELIEPAEALFLAHALVLPSNDPEDELRRNTEVEAIAVRYARAHEEAEGAQVHDVSTAALAVAAGLAEHPGFDLRSRRPDDAVRNIEVKGRARSGQVEMTENEYIQACNLGDTYWLYVVFDCASAHPRLLRVQNPFRKLIARAKGSVVIDEASVFANAAPE